VSNPYEMVSGMVLNLFFTAATGHAVYLFSHDLDCSDRLFLDFCLGITQLPVGCTDDVPNS